MSRTSVAGRARRLALGVALGLACTVAGRGEARAAVLYDFSLPANGSIGAVNVVLQFFDFVLPSGLIEAELTEFIVREASSGTPVDPTSSVGIEILGAATRFGLAFFQPGPGDPVLLTTGYPQDFFVFERTPRQTGTFLSSSGLLEPTDGLATRMPTATLVVSVLQVPEPATLSLLALTGLAVMARRRRARD